MISLIYEEFWKLMDNYEWRTIRMHLCYYTITTYVIHVCTREGRAVRILLLMGITCKR